MTKLTAFGESLLIKIDNALPLLKPAAELNLLAPVGWRKRNGTWFGWCKPSADDCERIGYVTFQATIDGVKGTKYTVLACRERVQKLRREIELAHRHVPKPRAKPYRRPEAAPLSPEKFAAVWATAEPDFAEAA